MISKGYTKMLGNFEIREEVVCSFFKQIKVNKPSDPDERRLLRL